MLNSWRHTASFDTQSPFVGHSWYVIMYIFSGFSQVCQNTSRTSSSRQTRSLGSDTLRIIAYFGLSYIFSVQVSFLTTVRCGRHVTHVKISTCYCRNLAHIQILNYGHSELETQHLISPSLHKWLQTRVKPSEHPPPMPRYWRPSGPQPHFLAWLFEWTCFASLYLPEFADCMRSW